MNQPDNRDLLHCILDGVLDTDPNFPKLFAAPIVHSKTSKIKSFVLAFNLEKAQDPQVAVHFKALLNRLLEIPPAISSEEQKIMREAIAACIPDNEPSIKIL
jgi:hypothetical protein